MVSELFFHFKNPVRNSAFIFLNSNHHIAFKETYQDYKIWELFRRNFKGQFSPAVPRLSCVGDDGFVKTSNPCAICRDRYLVLHHKV